MMDTRAKIDVELFLQNVSGEIKDLGKHFLTLISGILAFTVTFGEKVIDFTKVGPVEKYLLFFSWILLFCAFSAVGTGLWFNYNASMSALRGRLDHARARTAGVYWLFLLGGFGFVGGLALLVLAAAARMGILPWLGK
jgi:hypothetical protein